MTTSPALAMFDTNVLIDAYWDDKEEKVGHL
jgi:hypothetical protein